MPVARRPSSKLAARTSRCGRYWSDAVTHGSDALDLEAKVFTLGILFLWSTWAAVIAEAATALRRL